MKLSLVFRPDAEQEFFAAIAWYEQERPGLGQEFAHEVMRALEHALGQPELFRKARGAARKIRLKRFKAYSLYFAVKDDVLSVISVFHGSRTPAELRRRLV
jgi:plasmid stabilization system protein ParE